MNFERDLTENHYLVSHTVGPNQGGLRLDTFLKSRYRKRTRGQIQRSILEGIITVDRMGKTYAAVGKLKASSPLLEGDKVLVLSERKPEPEVDFNYRVLFEDEVLFVIDKPSNLPVHPAGRYFFNTLLTHLRTSGHTRPLDADHDYYLAHRLDKETSGVMVLTKTAESCTSLTRQFAERRTTKRYLAIAHGSPAQEEFKVDAPLRRTRSSPITVQMEVAPDCSEAEGGQEALTEFKVLKRAGKFSLMECRPKTGRQHQIRIHLEHAGHPIVGDKLYGMPVAEALNYYERKHLSAEAHARLLLPRHALHATWLRFFHPVTGVPMEFESPLPADLAEFLAPLSSEQMSDRQIAADISRSAQAP